MLHLKNVLKPIATRSTPSKKFSGMVAKRKLGKNPDTGLIVKLTVKMEKEHQPVGILLEPVIEKKSPRREKKINVIFDQLADKEATKRNYGIERRNPADNSKKWTQESCGRISCIIADGNAGDPELLMALRGM